MKEARHWNHLLSWHSRWVTLSWWCCFGSSQDDCWGGTGLMHVGEPSAVEGIWSLEFFFSLLALDYLT